MADSAWLVALAQYGFNGLSYASTLFLMAAGLTLVFGVTRIVNFAHGSFFMLGALFSAHWLVDFFPDWSQSAGLYALAMLLGAAVAALLGALAEWLLLRRLYGAPELYQLVATFGLGLALHDAMLWALGPQEVFVPRFPGLTGALEWGGAYFPVYQWVTMALGPLVWLGLYALLRLTRFGRQLRAATQDREMLGALGVNPRPLMLGAVALGCGLAGLAGALQLPREPAHLQMDVGMVVETFVVVVTGGLGSVAGAFVAAVLIGLVHAVGVALFPQSTLVLVFLTMAVVLALRPQGLLGAPLAVAGAQRPALFVLFPRSGRRFVGVCGALALALWAAAGADAWSLAGGQGIDSGLGVGVGAWVYWQSLACDALVLMLAGISLQAMMALGGLVSFGHAAFFALGAYGAALAHLHGGAALPLALLAGVALGVAVAAVFGAVLVRSAGVYLAMLSLALAQVLWAVASQWVALTGGDNGLMGLRLVEPAQRGAFLALLGSVVVLSLAGLRRLARSSLGAALQAVRDAPQRAQASGLSAAALKYRAFVGSAALAALAGGLFAAHKGSVFPSVASVATSLDVLLVVLLGGVHQLWGTAVGAAVLVGASVLGAGMDYWRGALGVLVMAIMVFAPSGLLGLRRRAPPGDAP